jgi:adenylate kinase
MRRTIFICGVHGAGKSSLCKELAQAIPAAHVTAGALIREASTPTQIVTVGAQNKQVPDVDTNQAALLNGLAAFNARTENDVGPLLLDGHCTLLTAVGEIADIPMGVFNAIRPTAILLVESSADVIHHRLAERAADAPSPEMIRRHAERERGRAEAVSTLLSVPLLTAAGDSPAQSDAVLPELRKVLGVDA